MEANGWAKRSEPPLGKTRSPFKPLSLASPQRAARQVTFYNTGYWDSWVELLLGEKIHLVVFIVFSLVRRFIL
jgi:hypothetical protein